MSDSNGTDLEIYPLIQSLFPCRINSTSTLNGRQLLLNKWVSDKIFKTGKSTTWKKALTNCNDEIYDPYIDGFDVTGDVKIKRKKQDDVSKNVFSSTVRPHPYSEDQLFTTKTIRSFKSVQGAFS